MQRRHISGLVLAAALLTACAARAPLTVGVSPAIGPFAATPLLRLALYEQDSKSDIVTELDAGQADTRRHLTPADQVARAEALWHAVSGGAVGRPIAWSNSDTGSHGYAEIMREVPIPESSRVCREYREAFVAAGRSASEVGQACQLRDGSWWKIEG